MSFLSRILSILPARQRRPERQRRMGLSLELLEDRWTPAIAISGQGTDAVTITDSNAGQTNNAIEIIDDLDSERTYIKINGGAEQVLGLSDSLLSTLNISMGTGKDKVSFSTRGAAHTFEHSVTRNIDMGSGDDALAINFDPAADVHGYVMTYNVLGDTTGNDTYSLAGTIKSGQLVFDLATVHEKAGNDTYNVNLTGTASSQLLVKIDDDLGSDRYMTKLNSQDNVSDVRTFINDFAGNDVYSTSATGNNAAGVVGTSIHDYQGNDSYTIAFSASMYAAELNSTVIDQGTGKNTVVVTQSGLLYGSLLNVELDFNTAPSSNKITIGGNGEVNNATTNYVVRTGDGADAISIDDNLLDNYVSANYQVYTGGGNDSVAFRFDGAPKIGFAAIGPEDFAEILVDLGAGNDSFAATYASGWTMTTADMGSSGFSLDVLGGLGNDSLAVKSDGKPMYVIGVHADFDVTLDGDGNDTIDVNLGQLGSYGYPPVTIGVHLLAGTGADKVSFAGTLNSNDPDVTMTVDVDLGVDTVKDSFKSTFKYAALPTQTVFNGHVEHAYVHQDSVSIATGSTAAPWDGIE